MVNNRSTFKTKYAKFSTKWQALLNFHNPSCAYNQRCNLYQKTVPLLKSVFTSLFHPYLFIKSSLQSPVKLPFYTSAIFHLPLFAYNNPSNLYQKLFSLPKRFCQFRLRQGSRELGNIVTTATVLISLFLLKIQTVIARLTHNHRFFIAQTPKTDILQVW